MADLNLACSVLRGLQRAVTETADGFSMKIGRQEYFITSEEIDEYVALKSLFQRPSETQLFLPGRYEHVVQHEGRQFLTRDPKLALQSNDGSTRVEVSTPSSIFMLCLTDVEKLNREVSKFLRDVLPPREDKPRKFTDLARRIQTIKVSTNPNTALGKSAQRMHEIAEAATFHFAYGQGLAISFAKTWERTYYWLGLKQKEDVQFPLRTYNTELISYYNLALSTDSLILSYLALYKILEYFYTSVSEEDLHKRLRELLVTPDFSHTKAKKLRELIKTIRTFDTKHNEQSSLKLVLTTFFDKADIQNWIESYEQKNGKHFTGNVSIFGIPMQIDLSDNTIIPNVASRIYHIRNALVHNKEGEVSRFIPYTGQEEALVKEVQILVFLAEQVIIKTGKDL